MQQTKLKNLVKSSELESDMKHGLLTAPVFFLADLLMYLLLPIICKRFGIYIRYMLANPRLAV